MRMPSAKKLGEAFPWMDKDEIKLVRSLGRNVDDPDKLAAIVEDKLPATHSYVRQMYSDPYNSGMWRRTVALNGMDEVMGMAGVEAIEVGGAVEYEYLNAGDTYATTLIYDADKDRLFIGTYGDVVERLQENPLGPIDDDDDMIYTPEELHRVLVGGPIRREYVDPALLAKMDRRGLLDLSVPGMVAIPYDDARDPRHWTSNPGGGSARARGPNPKRNPKRKAKANPRAKAALRKVLKI